MGLRQTTRHHGGMTAWAALESGEETHAANRAAPAPTYLTLAERRHHRNAGWRTRLEDLPPAPAPHEDWVSLTEDERAAVRARRGERRAFDGAPPIVPHAIDQRQAASCLSCHGQPTLIGSVAVAQISHPPYQNCLQCHAAGAGPAPGWASPVRPPTLQLASNDFVGVTPPTATQRAFDEAPPVISHPLWMRENCMSCHGAGGSSAVRPDHGGRQSCLQCHTTSSGLEQRPMVATLATPCHDEMAHLPPALLAAIEALDP
jgi:nitrate reductase (cytochrome), electron transfer subunit